MTLPAFLYIVASPRPQVGKTLLSRLLIEFFTGRGRSIVGYDLHSREPALATRFPKLVWSVDITDTSGQMELFDRLLAEDSATKIVDLGYGPYDQFFSIMAEIEFAQEAHQRLIEPIVLFITDQTEPTMRSYAKLRDKLPATTFIPVHNEAVSVTFDQREFPPSHREDGIIQVPRLAQLMRGVIDRPGFTFNAYMDRQPYGPTEMHSWIDGIFTEFRALELRLLMGKMTSTLGGGGGNSARRARPRELR